MTLTRSGWVDCEQKPAECEYSESNRLLTEQFIGGLNDDNITDEKCREVTMLLKHITI